jgi:hypothetical protein
MIAAIPFMAGCESDRGGSPDPSSEAPAADQIIEGPAFAETSKSQSGPGSGGSALVLVDVEVAEADGFDRIVLEFSGTGTPGWDVNYVDEAVLDGSGDVVALGGAAVLDIYASGTTWPAPDYYRGPSRLTPEVGGRVSEVYVVGTFEGTTQVLAGIDGAPVPFRVFALAAPSRLVVDVAHRNAEPDS